MLNIRHHTLALASAACALSTLAQAQQSVLITANRQAMAVENHDELPGLSNFFAIVRP